MRRLALTLALTLASSAAFAQGAVESHDFEGGKLTITETATGEKEIRFDGRLLASNYFVLFEREAEVAGANVALITVGDGGNACAPGTLIVWKNGAEVDADYVGDDCGAPSPSVSGDRIFFVPYLLPGETADVVSWTPQERTSIAGRLSFAPQPETTWQDLDLKGLDHIISSFRNADVFKASEALLKTDITEVATALSVGGGIEMLPSGIGWSSGCVPHACGISDGFMAIDPKNRAVYLAQQQQRGGPKAWPDEASWPADLRDAMIKAIGTRQ